MLSGVTRETRVLCSKLCSDWRYYAQIESLVTRGQNLKRKEFKRILESEAHPCKRFLEKPVDHGHNLRSCKTNPVHLRIPVSRTVRHKQSFIPRGAKLNLI